MIRVYYSAGGDPPISDKGGEKRQMEVDNEQISVVGVDNEVYLSR